MGLFTPINIILVIILMFATFLVTRKSLSGESYTEILKATFIFLLGYVQALIAFFKSNKSE